MARVFTLKTYGAKLYKWSPAPNQKNIKEKQGRPFFCTATAGSNGQDWISTYAFTPIIVNDILEKQAYVECDYVQ